MRKMETLEIALPEPARFRMENGQWKMDNDGEVDVLLVGWGSTKNTVLDVLEVLEGKEGNIGYLHYTYLWPLKTARFQELAAKAKRVILIEGNYQGQLGAFLREKTGIEIKEKLLKYDGRPFFLEELRDALLAPGPLVPHQDIVRTSSPSSPSSPLLPPPV
ncbi:MAG: transketolase C-terminal domain-containing protein [Patescibacteria group bacterium]